MLSARLKKKRMTRTRRSKLRRVAETVFRLFGVLEVVCYPANNTLETSRYEIASAKLPAAFDGYTIVQISDLHGKEFGKDNGKLLDAIEKEKPDLVVVTGDLVDERHFQLDKIRVFLERLVRLAPVFYATGNHEADFFDEYFNALMTVVRESGAGVLLDQESRVTRGGSGASIIIAGVRDPRFDEPYEELLDQKLARFSNATDEFRLLLSHRPEGLDLYAKHGFDLVFSGHAHGGQFRVPLLCPQGLNAPGQGWFPKLTAGVCVKDATTLIVSRGLGPSVIPTRLFNRPELVVCRLRRDDSEGMENRRRI